MSFTDISYVCNFLEVYNRKYDCIKPIKRANKQNQYQKN